MAYHTHDHCIGSHHNMTLLTDTHLAGRYSTPLPAGLNFHMACVSPNLVPEALGNALMAVYALQWAFSRFINTWPARLKWNILPGGKFPAIYPPVASACIAHNALIMLSRATVLLLFHGMRDKSRAPSYKVGLSEPVLHKSVQGMPVLLVHHVICSSPCMPDSDYACMVSCITNIL